MNPEDEAVFEYALRGKDWNVYWLLLKNGRSMSVREVQKTLRFSSPSVAQHHLEQLRQLGLVKKEEIGGKLIPLLYKCLNGNGKIKNGGTL